MNKYNPITLCQKCQQPIYDRDENKSSVKCSICLIDTNKKLHQLNGAELKKVGDQYSLSFSQFKEQDLFDNYNDLQIVLDRLYQNESGEKI